MSSCRNPNCPGAHGEGGTKADPDHIVIHSHPRRGRPYTVRDQLRDLDRNGKLCDKLNAFVHALMHLHDGEMRDARICFERAAS